MAQARISFADLVEEALLAFTLDVSYAERMARAATTITRKRDVWAERRRTPPASSPSRQRQPTAV